MASEVATREGGARTVGDIVKIDTADPFFRNRNNFDLARERAKSTFSADTMTEMLCGGKERWNVRKKVREAILNDPVFSNDDRIFSSREIRYQRALDKYARIKQLENTLALTEEETIMLRQESADDYPLALHEFMFVPNLKACCTEEQLAVWLPRCERLEILGCYAQTEIGHGSNVRGMETTATLIPGSDEFEIHTPTVSATKFWPGSLGKTATHGMVYARLCVADKFYGVHGFIVPLRDTQTHKLLPGITAGDIGPKIGYNNMDNGWCRFERVRIPRSNMPMRFVSVTKEGKVEASGMDKAGYVTMMELRALMVVDSRDCLAKACTIAVRYSAVRRQGLVDKRTGIEPQVLSYAIQRHRLLVLVADAYAFHFTGSRILPLVGELRSKVQQGDASSLQHVHGVLCGLKAVCTRMCSDGIEECRKCCGGQGYLLSSGLPELLGYALHYATAEGDNYVMAQQCSRYLLKILQQAQGGEAAAAVGDLAYLGGGTRVLEATCKASSVEEMRDARMLQEAYYQRSLFLLLRLAERYLSEVSAGKSAMDAWNAIQVEQHAAVQAHVMSTLVANFLTDAYAESNAQCGEWMRVAPVLRKMGLLFALNHLTDDASFLESAFLRPDQMEMARAAVRALEEELAGEAVALVDAFWFSDLQLASAIGRYDGNAYLGLLEATTGSDLNKSEPVSCYASSLRPIMKSKL